MQAIQSKKIHLVPVLVGASNMLVAHRELRIKYCTNRSIKTWSFYFLLKSLTCSGKIQHWIKQKADLLDYLQCNEQTFRSRINELKAMGLCKILPGYSIELTSYKNAATILGIDYAGLITISYNPEELKGTNMFAYMLRADELRHNQDAQRTALNYHLDKNPLLLSLITNHLQLQGCDIRKLKTDPVYLQEKLLKFQEQSFKHGSEILNEIMQRRADVNRGLERLKDDHGYKHQRSVAYLKKVMEKMGIITVVKRSVTSEARSRRYVPGPNGRKDGYMYMKKAKATYWALCDQLIINNKIFNETGNEKINKGAVAA